MNLAVNLTARRLHIAKDVDPYLPGLAVGMEGTPRRKRVSVPAANWWPAPWKARATTTTDDDRKATMTTTAPPTPNLNHAAAALIEVGR